MKDREKSDWEIREDLPKKMLNILGSNESEAHKVTSLEDSIVFIEKGYFLRDIEYTSGGAMKDTTFFWEKGELIKLMKVLPGTLKQRVLPVLLNKIELMLIKEKQSFLSLSTARKLTTVSHDRHVFRNLAKVIKDDLIETKEFLLENQGYEAASRLLTLIPGNDYFNLYEN